jgi:N-acetylornithine carbamoyltransferase
MQTDLRNRDLISDLDFSKEEVETVLDVALDLKRNRALGEPLSMGAISQKLF